MSLIIKEATSGVSQVGGQQQFLGGVISTIGKIGGGIIRTAGRIAGIIPAAGAGAAAGGAAGAIQRIQEQQRRAPPLPPLPQNGRGQVPVPGTRGALERLIPGGRSGFMACPSGFHPNKTSYFLKDGTFVEKGTRCVKNRRRNPLNPRAASRAISRIESGKKAIKRFDRVQIKCRRCGLVRCKC